MDQVGNGGTAVQRLVDLPSRDLQAALVLIDVHDLAGSDIALVIQARTRLLAWVQAEAAVDINEFVHCPPAAAVPTARVEAVQEFASDELALLLHVAPMTGRYLVMDAVDLVQRHPRLCAALSDGLIDLRKVKAVTALCPDTDPALAAALDDALLATAERPDGSTALDQTVAETPRALGLRAQRVLSALDPSWTRAARRETLHRRRLVTGTYGAGIGIGYLGLHDIDVTAMAAAYEHVNAIARGIKRLGDTRTLDQVRADTALDLLTGGTPTPGASDSTNTTSKASATEERPDDAAGRAEHTADADADGENRATHPARAAGEAEHPANNDATEGRQRPDDALGEAESTPSDPLDADTPSRAHTDTGDTATEPDPARPDPHTADDGVVPSPYPAPRARADVDLIVHINTLADLADALRRGTLVDVAGFGLVPADVAARLVKAAADRPSTWCMTVVDDTGRVVEHVRTHHDPTRAMREFVNARDRHCRFPGCTVTATRCDTDHTKSWETGGATCACNLTPLCRRHHRLKQAHGFNLNVDPDTNNARWTTPHTTGTTTPPWQWTNHDHPPPF